MASLSWDFLVGREQVSPAMKRMGDQADKTEKKLGRFGSVAGASFSQAGVRLRSFTGFAATGLLGAGVAMGAAGAAAAGMGLKTASGLQQADIAFTTLLKSSAKSKVFLKDLSAFAAKTPFELPGLIDSSRLLLGVGLDAKKVIPTLQDFGDAAGALGIQQEAFQRIMLATSQAISAGKFNTGDLNQIVEAGIPVWSLLSKAMGKPVPEIRKMAEGGQLLSSKVLPLLREQMHKDYGGAMAKQSQTLSGLWSTFMDTLNIGLANAIMPLVPVLQKILPGAMSVVGGALTGISSAMAAFVGGITGSGPAVAGFAGVLRTLGLGLRALVLAFQEGDVTSDGFVGAMERVGVAARSAFDFFATSVMPRLRDFAGFITGTVVPALGSMAGFVSRNRDFFIPFVGALVVAKGVFLTVAAATRVWAAAQAVLNAVLAINPITIVIGIVAALAGVLYLAYTRSETFRKIVDGAFRFVAASASSMWNSFLKPTFAAIVAAFGFIGRSAASMWNDFLKPSFRAIVTAFKAVGTAASFLWDKVLKPTFRFIVAAFLWMAQDFIDGATLAFGWIPKLGDKLRNASTAFRKFRDQVNDSLGGVKNRSVSVTASLRGIDVRTLVGTRGGPNMAGRLWSGGRIPGPDATRDNRIVPMRGGGQVAVASGEYVMPVDKTKQFLPVLEAMRAGQLSRLPIDGFAAGGLIPRARTPSRASIARVGSTFDARVAGTAAAVAARLKALAESFGGGPPGRRVTWRGHRFNERTVRMIQSAERLARAVFHISQGSYSTRVAASGSTHAGGGAVDIGSPTSMRAQTAMRRAGFAAWIRTPGQGPWARHIHGIAIGDPTASPAAKRQVASFRRGGNGLGGMVAGGLVPRSFDSGGWLDPGWTLAHNGTGRRERVSSGGGDVHIHLHGPVGSQRELENWLTDAMDRLRRKGRA